MVGVDSLLGLGVQADRLAVEQESHDVDVVRCQIQNHSHVPDASREGAQPRRLDLKDATKLPSREPATQLADGGIESLDVPDGQQQPSVLGCSDHRFCVGTVRGDGLLDQDVRP